MAVGFRSLAGFPLGAGVGSGLSPPLVGFTSLFWWMGGVGGTAPIAEPTGGGWLTEEQVRRHDEERRKRKDKERELEETIKLAYQRLTGKITPPPAVIAAQGKPELLSEAALGIAAKLVQKSNESAKMRTRNAQVIADLNRLANEILQLQEIRLYEAQMEEEAIVMLLLN